MRVIDLGMLQAAADGSTFTLADYDEEGNPGRKGLFVISTADDAVLTAGLFERDPDDAVPAWVLVPSTSRAFIAGDVQVVFTEVTLNDPTIRFEITAFTTGDAHATLILMD